MSTIQPALAVRHVSKDYELHASNLSRFLHFLLGRHSPMKPRYFPALRDISFEVMPGEAIAILGRNGAGKSTLLQVMSNLLSPSSGTVTTAPRVISLLELGSGFSGDFTGRENIMLNGAILGMERSEIESKTDEIIAFADIGDYIDQPVRTYSSGMFLRLAFAIATSAAPDLLMIDEVLAVGDIFFRQKCYDRLNAMRKSGTAIVLVTHSLSDAAEFCSRGLVLSEGQVAYYGDGVGAVQHFVHHEQSARTGQRNAEMLPLAVKTPENAPEAPPSEWLAHPAATDLTGTAQISSAHVQLEKLLITDEEDKPRTAFFQGEWMRIRASFVFGADAGRVIAGVGIRNVKNILVHAKHGINLPDEASPAAVPENSRMELCYDVKLDLDFGEYTLDLGTAEVAEDAFARRGNISVAEFPAHITMLCAMNGISSITIVGPAKYPHATYSHLGIADLPNRFSTTLTTR